MTWMDALQEVVKIAKEAAPVMADLVNMAEKVGEDVSTHVPISQAFSNAVAGLEKALADAQGIL